jgi:hypothetical protein
MGSELILFRLLLLNVLEDFLKLLELGNNNRSAVPLGSVQIEVVLVVLFRRIKNVERGDLRDDLPIVNLFV